MDDKIRIKFVASPKTIKMGIFTKIITPKDILLSNFSPILPPKNDPIIPERNTIVGNRPA